MPEMTRGERDRLRAEWMGADAVTRARLSRQYMPGLLDALDAAEARVKDQSFMLDEAAKLHDLVAKQRDEAEQRAAEVMPCGHHSGCVWSSGEGTSHCAACEAQQRTAERIAAWLRTVRAPGARFEAACWALAHAIESGDWRGAK